MSELELTKKELSTVAGYTYRRLYDIDMALPDDKKLFVKKESGKYDLPLFVQRWVNYNVDTEVQEDTSSLSVIKAKHEAVKIKKTELELARMQGQLVDVQDVRELWGTIANNIMQNMIHLADKVAPLLLMMDNTEQIAAIIDGEMRKILGELSETPLPEYAAEEDRENEKDGEEIEEDEDD